MDKRKKYFVKQKLAGVLLILIGVFTAILDSGDITALLIMLPIALTLIFTKEKVWMSDYYYEDDEGEEF